MAPKYRDVKHPQFGDLQLSTSGPLPCALTGLALLRNPYFNKGSAFTSEERGEFELHGLLPPNVQSLEGQVGRAYAQYKGKPDQLAKNTFMNSLRVQNEVLFYKVHKC
jgi:malate dehydrogenase (oxaloacetate-decarboxylating)